MPVTKPAHSTEDNDVDYVTSISVSSSPRTRRSGVHSPEKENHLVSKVSATEIVISAHPHRTPLSGKESVPQEVSAPTGLEKDETEAAPAGPSHTYTLRSRVRLTAKAAAALAQQNEAKDGPSRKRARH